MTIACTFRPLRLMLVTATALSSLALHAQDAPAPNPAAVVAPVAELEQQFRDPPASARPRVWWHWMNGNVTKDGIAKDFAWMKRVGIGGVQNFDANLATPQVVDKRLVYMTPEWKDAFRFAVAEAERQGLEFAIASSPGWSETGGPWVKPEDAMKKLVWSETIVKGGKRFAGTLAPPPSVTGVFQSLAGSGSLADLMAGPHKKASPVAGGDVRVIAWPEVAAADPVPSITGADGKPVDAALLLDSDLSTGTSVMLNSAQSPFVTLDYPQPRKVQSARLFIGHAWMMWIGALVTPHLEVSRDGKTWQKVADLPVTNVPTTVSFAPVTAQHFRVVIGRPDTSNFTALFSKPAPGVDPASVPYGDISRLGRLPFQIGELRLFDTPRIDQAEVKAGFQIAPDYYALSASVPEAKGIDPAKVIDLTNRLKPDGSLDWTPPKGSWRVVRFGWSLVGTTNHPATEEATGLEVDKFDGAAVRRYLNHYLGMYRDAAGADMVGKRGVSAILTDSIEVGASNWTPRMIEQFKRLRGYDPVPWMPALTGAVVRSRAESDRFLFDYRRTLADLLASEHYGTVAQVARENGMIVYGEALENGRPSLGDDMAMRRHATIPMAAMWTHTREEGPQLNYLVDVRGAASVAHIYGQNLVATEALTSSMAYWGHGPAFLKRVIDLAFVNGLNRPVIHTSVHQPVDDKVPGLSLGMFGQYFNRHEAWAELAGPWVDYLSRTSLMLQQGRNVADVAYFFGEEAPLTQLFKQQRVPDAPRLHAYDFLNADALTGALANDGADLVTPGGARYKAIALGGTSRRMSLPVLRKLVSLVEGGATVIGMKPEADPGLGGDAGEYASLLGKLWPEGAAALGGIGFGKGRVIASNDSDAALAAIGVAPQFRFTANQADAAIPFVHRRLVDGDSFFLVNQKDRSETIEAHFRVTGKAPELWHAETGTSEPLSYRIENGETVVPLTLRGDESVHVVFRKPAVADALAIKKLEPVEKARLDGPWTVAFQPGRGAPASITLPALAPLDQHADAGVKFFSGVATYSRSFQTPRGWKAGQQLWLDLGEAGEVAEVRINGKPAGSAWRAPYRMDIAALARPGRNSLEVRVANLWVNRLVGDRQPGAQKVTWTAQPVTYLPDAPLRKSGLIGPVTLQGQADN